MYEETNRADEIRRIQERAAIVQKGFNRIRKSVNESASRFEKRNRVTETTVILMLAVAGLYDLMQFGLNFIPVIGWILASLVGVWSWLTFYTWTSIKGWGSADTLKKWVVKYGLPILGIAPIGNWGPEITIGVFFTIAIVKSDDFIYNKTQGKMDSAIIKQGIQYFNLFRDTNNV